jgi:hypothetical protein
MLINNREKRTAWMENTASRSNTTAAEKEWATLWSVKVPSKVRNFLWRLARHSLPSRDVLHHRHMEPASSCVLCGEEDSWRHSLLECNMARCVWALEEEEITEQLGIIQIPNAKAWPTEIFKTFAGAPLVRVVVVLGAIWHARRKAIHEEIYQSPCNQMLCRSIPGRARMCSTTTKRQRKSQGGGGRMPPQWIPPPVGMMKINVDASVSKNKKISSVVLLSLTIQPECF